MSKAAMTKLKEIFTQDTETILEWHEWIQETHDFEFNFAFLCIAMGSLQSYLESGKTKITDLKLLLEDADDEQITEVRARVDAYELIENKIAELEEEAGLRPPTSKVNL